MSKLPKGWEVKSFGALVENLDGKRIPLSAKVRDNLNGNVPYYGASGIIDFVEEHIFDGEHLLVSEDGANLVARKYPIAFIAKGKFWVNNHAHIVKAKTDCTSNRYLELYFSSINISEYVTGSAQPKLNQKNLNKISIVLPSLPEQKRIVAKLDTLFQRIDKSIALLQENIQQTEKLVASSLDGIFDELSNKYPSAPLLKYVDFVGGSQPPKSKFSNERKDGFVRLIQIRDYKSDRFVVYIDEKSTKKFCKADDVMIGRYGPPVFQILRGLEGAYNVALMKAIPDEEIISKDFLFYFLQNGKIQNYIISISQRAAGQSGVNKKALEQYQLVIPPLDIQDRTVIKIKKLQDNLSKLQIEQQTKLTNLKALKESILDKAFKGEL